MPVEEGNEQVDGDSLNPGLLHYLVGLCGTCLPTVMSAVKKKSSSSKSATCTKRIRRETWPAVVNKQTEMTLRSHSSENQAKKNSNRNRTQSSADYNLTNSVNNCNNLEAINMGMIPMEEDEVSCQSEVMFDFNSLPEDCQLNIFSFLTPVERGVAAQVCHDWHSLLLTPSLWNMVDLTVLPLCKKVKLEHKCGPKCYDTYKKRVKSFIHFLETVNPALRCFRFALDIGDSRDKWLSAVEGLLRSSYCQDMEVAHLDWRETPVKPFFLDDHSHLRANDNAYSHRRRQRIFISFLDFFTTKSPNLKKLIVPFDWSEPSLDLIARLGPTLHTLVIEKYFVFRQLPQESLDRLFENLPKLSRLILEVWTPSSKGLLQYRINSNVLEYLDISQSRGFYLQELNTPNLKVFKVARHPWNGPLTRIDDVRIPCVYTVLREGAGHLHQLNEHTLRDGWRDETYPELETVLRAICSCPQHKSGWAM